MKCKHCGYTTNSEKIFYLHEDKCLQVQNENGLEKNPTYDEMNLNELKKLAAGRGLIVKGKKKEEIIIDLKELEREQDDNDTGKSENDPANSNNGE